MEDRAAQVVFTLTQFPTVQRVTFHIAGKPIAALGGEGIPANNVSRADFTNATPLVLVETPVPFQTVASPLVVTGLSNTFEATVNYTVTGPTGAVLAEGFTTATAGSGTWGTFRFTATLKATSAGAGQLSAYQVSPKDGSRQDVYDVPIHLS